MDIGLAGVDQVQSLMKIDPRVIEGMDFWLSEDLGDFSTLQRVVSEAAAGENYGRWLDTLKGYAAEQIAADVLVSSGAHVELAPNPNQAGWDLRVDGEYYNVKVGTTASHIEQHFQEYPDIGVVTSPELAAQFPEYADQIIALPELSNENLVEAVEETVSGVTGVDWDFPFPVVTAVYSGIRELDLLLSGDTELGTSLRNLGLDVAGTGGGSWLGGKAGSALGLAIGGPPGVVIGGVVGGIAGALFGRSFTNQIKLDALNRAREQFERKRDEIQAQLTVKHQNLQEAVLTQVNGVQRELRTSLRQMEEMHRANACRIKADYEAAVARFVATVPGCLEAAADRIANTTASALTEMPESPWLVRLVWPSQRDIEKEAFALWSRREQRRLRGAARKIRRFTRVYGTQTAYAKTLAVLEDRLLQVTELAPAVEELSKAHVQALTALAVERAKLEHECKGAVAAAVRRLAAVITEETTKLHAWLEEQAEALRSLGDQVRAEMRRLGLKPTPGQ
ncbi:MAG: hypothetical protein H0Z37_01815 [Firmicutes bacterium]|nr:hypothetical protein [Bacillota bacterium]